MNLHYCIKMSVFSSVVRKQNRRSHGIIVKTVIYVLTNLMFQMNVEIIVHNCFSLGELNFYQIYKTKMYLVHQVIRYLKEDTCINTFKIRTKICCVVYITIKQKKKYQNRGRISANDTFQHSSSRQNRIPKYYSTVLRRFATPKRKIFVY